MTRATAGPGMLPHAELCFFPDAEHFMVMPALQEHWWTLAEVERLVEDRPGHTPRYELIDGELLVTPAPGTSHQILAGSLYAQLREYTRKHRVGLAIISPSTVQLAPESRVEPDVFVAAELPGHGLPKAFPITALMLAIEVLSPSSARYDRGRKRRFYQDSGVPEYWIVDGDARLVEVWLPSDERPAIQAERIAWQPNANVEPLIIDLAALFAEALLGDGAPLEPRAL